MIASFLALIFGLLIGSFLNVCIHRWPRNRSVVKPRSHCVRCRRPIAWYDNIPLVSYLVLGGRCRHCRARISLRYPVVEFLTAMLFFYEVQKLGPTLPALKMCVFCAIAVALIFCDLEKRLLPDELTKGGIVLGLCFAPFVPVPDFTASLRRTANHLNGRILTRSIRTSQDSAGVSRLASKQSRHFIAVPAELARRSHWL